MEIRGNIDIRKEKPEKRYKLGDGTKEITSTFEFAVPNHYCRYGGYLNICQGVLAGG